MPRVPAGQPRQRAYRNRAVYRAHGPRLVHDVDPNIVAECVPLWIEAAKRANSRYGDEKQASNKGRDAALYSCDDRLRERGVTWQGDRFRWLSYEKAIRAAAQGAR